MWDVKKMILPKKIFYNRSARGSQSGAEGNSETSEITNNNFNE